MTYKGPLKTGNPYDYEGKIIHVGTPGIFHKPTSGMNLTKCGRDMTDARATDHRLEDYQPCVVCWPPAAGDGGGADDQEIARIVRERDETDTENGSRSV